jgi:plastocyanin
MSYGAPMHRSIARLTLAFAAALLLLAALAGPSIAADKWVTMFDNKYLPPGPVVIRVGDKVTWVNDDDVPHDARGNGWGTPLLSKGDSHAVRFTRAGTYRFTCTIHPEMVGRVVVQGRLATVPPANTASEGAAGQTADVAPAVVAILAAAALTFGLALRRSGRPRG